MDPTSSPAVTIGTLPTDFTHPTSCNTPWIAGDGGLFYYGSICGALPGAQTTTLVNSACYPSPLPDYFSSGLVPVPAFFSPASVCPQGLTSACNVTRDAHDSGIRSPNPVDQGKGPIYGALSNGETAIGCCPTGYECAAIDYCESTLTEGLVVTGISYGLECSSQPTSYTFQSARYAEAYLGPVLQMNVWLVHNSERVSGDSGNSAGSSGMSTGAKLGLILGLCLGGVSLAIVYFIAWHRRRKLGRRGAVAQEGTTADLPPHMQKPELHGSGPDVGSGVNGPVLQRKELDTSSDLKPPELDGDGKDAASRARHELDSSASATITNLAELSSDPYRHELDVAGAARLKPE